MRRSRILITCDTELWDKEMLLDKNVLSPLRHLTALSKTYDVPINLFLAAYNYESRDFDEPFVDSWTRLTDLKNSNFSVQLHLHAKGIVNNNDRFGELSLAERDQALKLAIERINKTFGKSPNSFRAGGYRIGEDILASFDLLARNNIKYDFSIAPNKIVSKEANFENLDLEFIKQNSRVTPIPLPTDESGRIYSCERFDEGIVHNEIKNCKNEYFVLDFHSFFVHQSSGKRIVAIVEFLLNVILNKMNKLLGTRIYFQSKAFRDFNKLVAKLKTENYSFINLENI